MQLLNEDDISAYGVRVRNEPYEAPCQEQIKLATLWLRGCRVRKTVNRRVSSYGLKHLVERFHRARTDRSLHGGCYVSNGALIVAAIRLGFDCVQCCEGSPNAYLSVSQHSITETQEYLDAIQ